jgi:hypothetical protein
MGRPEHGPKKHGPRTAWPVLHSARAWPGPPLRPCLGRQFGPQCQPRPGPANKPCLTQARFSAVGSPLLTFPPSWPSNQWYPNPHSLSAPRIKAGHRGGRRLLPGSPHPHPLLPYRGGRRAAAPPLIPSFRIYTLTLTLPLRRYRSCRDRDAGQQRWLREPQRRGRRQR